MDLTPFGDDAFWSRGARSRADAFRALRDEAPVVFMDEPEVPSFPRGPGFWSVSRYADVVHVSKHPEIFSSARGTNIPDLPIEIAEFTGSMINMDAPRHTRMRRIVNRAFTPARIAAVDADVRHKARALVAGVAERGSCDFAVEIASQLPLQVICEMMGIPRDAWARVLALSNVILGDQETVADAGALMMAMIEMAQIAEKVGDDRLARPQDDLVSAMVHAAVDDERLTPREVASFFILLTVAGNETTRNAISVGLHELTVHADARARWQGDFEGLRARAVEELVRVATPVIHFRRTALVDTELAGQKIAAGDKVVVWYESANADERVFTDPQAFDLARTPNEHVAYGAGGPHFCLGANLARREIGVLFEELFRWLPDLRAAAGPDYLVSSFIHGVKRLPCTFTARSVPAP